MPNLRSVRRIGVLIMATDSAVVARVPLVPVQAEPSLRAEMVTELVAGELADVTGREEEWLAVRTRVDEYTGFVHEGYVTPVEGEEAALWEKAAWCGGGSGDVVFAVAGDRMTYPLRARVLLRDDGWVRLPDGRSAELVRGQVLPLDQAIARAGRQPVHRWVAAAFAGTPYRWGGVTPWGADCSGLVQTAWRARGVHLPRDAGDQALGGDVVSPEAIAPDDLLFFRGDVTDRITHVGIAAPEGHLIHCAVACGGLTLEALHGTPRGAALRERLVSVRRITSRRPA